MDNDKIMNDFIDTHHYMGEVRDWRDVPETDTSEDEPVEQRREADVPDNTNIRARVLIPDGDGAWAIGDPPMLPGGRVKTGESVRAAAIREVLEETGLRIMATMIPLCTVNQGAKSIDYFVGERMGGKLTMLDHDGHTPVNPRIVSFDELTMEQDKQAVAAYLKR